MNNTQFAVMQSQSGALTLVNQQSVLFWELNQVNHEVVETGSKRHCEDYIQTYMEENYLTAE